MNSEKSNKIKESLKSTKERRKSQICRVFEVKVDKSHMSKKTQEQTKRVFLEAKWLYNFILSQDDVFSVDDKIKEVQIKVKDEFEIRTLDVLGSQIKQSVIESIGQNICNLSRSKKKGNKVGKLNFISYCDSVDLKQFGNTYRIKGSRVKLQGIKQTFRVRGLGQLKNYEIANAKFIQKSGDYYFHITTFYNKPDEKPILIKKRDIGMDYGIDHQLTISDGQEGIFIDYRIPFPKRLRKLYQKLSKKELHSASWYKQLILVNKEFEYLTNCKEDTKNKICNILTTKFRHTCYQNDNFRGWQRIWGKRMLSTGIGGITARLKKSATSVKVDRFFASTKKCSRCDNKQDIALDERIYLCKSCRHEAPRDKNSSDNILFEGLRTIGVEYTEYTPTEIEPLLSILGKLNAIPRVKASSVVDVGSLAYS